MKSEKQSKQVSWSKFNKDRGSKPEKIKEQS